MRGRLHAWPKTAGKGAKPGPGLMHDPMNNFLRSPGNRTWIRIFQGEYYSRSRRKWEGVGPEEREGGVWEGSEGEGEAGLEGRCEMSAYLFICVFIIIIFRDTSTHLYLFCICAWICLVIPTFLSVFIYLYSSLSTYVTTYNYPLSLSSFSPSLLSALSWLSFHSCLHLQMGNNIITFLFDVYLWSLFICNINY